MSVKSNTVVCHVHQIQSWDSDMFKYMLPFWQSCLLTAPGGSNTHKPFTPPFHTMQIEVVELIFSLCEQLSQPLPVYFLSVDIFDDFIRRHVAQLFECTARTQKDEADFKKCWRLISKTVHSQLYLRLLSCVQLASKVVFAGLIVTNTDLQILLSNAGQQYNSKSILSSELKVLETVDFKIPLHSALDVMEQLVVSCAHPAGLQPERFYPVCVATLKLAYLQHSKLRESLWWAAGRRDESSSWELNVLVAAAGVLAACRLSSGERSARSLARHLAAHTRRALPDLKGLAAIIVTLALD